VATDPGASAVKRGSAMSTDRLAQQTSDTTVSMNSGTWRVQSWRPSMA